MTRRNHPKPFVFSLVLVLLAAFNIGCGGASQSAADAASAEPKPPVTPEDPEQGEEPVEDSGTLDILSDPPQEVLLDGEKIGKTPLTNYRVKAGSHDVTFLDPTEGDRTMSVNVSPGDRQTVKLDHAPKIRETN